MTHRAFTLWLLQKNLYVWLKINISIDYNTSYSSSLINQLIFPKEPVITFWSIYCKEKFSEPVSKCVSVIYVGDISEGIANSLSQQCITFFFNGKGKIIGQYQK